MHRRRFLGRGGPAADEFQARVPSADDGLCFHAYFRVVLDIVGVDALERVRIAARIRRDVLRATAAAARAFSLAERGVAEAELTCLLLDHDLFDHPRVRDFTAEVRLVGADGEAPCRAGGTAVEEFLHGLVPAQRSAVLEDLAAMMRRWDRPDLAERLVRPWSGRGRPGGD
ncbi:hypothetical protein O4J56_12465 [Nocardiopsis sp. RSe5-2]|uniref:Uncharacterized protein n=1 Tax=Nocardiopsis endophytica TaxID=3018445 RepID=A0ABT4U3B9_9ACTN|nr:hypothetical protein [Nocardiopsis endophytica]MDA2811448.1 hypothetical protein [Nocardiopsis endophytica]